MINNNSQVITVETFNLYQDKTINKKVVFLNKVIIRAPFDDFIEKIDKSVGDYVDSNTIILQMESNEEAYQLAKAKNEFAISILTSGKAVQEEKKQAVELANKKLENTKIKTPVEGYIIKMPINEKLFVSKGTILSEILPSNSNAYIQISSEEENLIKYAEFVELQINPFKESQLLDYMKFIEQNGVRFLEIKIDIDQLNREYLDSLYCEAKITYSEETASWIPAEYVLEEFVFLKNGRKKEIEILDEKNNLYLVSGISDGDVLIKKR